MCEEIQLARYNSDVLEKYANAPEKYAIEKDALVTDINHAWMIKYYRNPSVHNMISVFNGDIPDEEQEHWEQYRVGVARFVQVDFR